MPQKLGNLQRLCCSISSNLARTSPYDVRGEGRNVLWPPHGTPIDAAINQIDSPQCENKLRIVRLSRGLRLPSEASFCGAFPLRRMFLPKVATFALHDPVSDCFVTDFCEARYSLRSGNAPKRSGGQVAEGDREAIRKYPRESINHRSLSTLFIAGAIRFFRIVISFWQPRQNAGFRSGGFHAEAAERQRAQRGKLRRRRGTREPATSQNVSCRHESLAWIACQLRQGETRRSTQSISALSASPHLCVRQNDNAPPREAKRRRASA